MKNNSTSTGTSTSKVTKLDMDAVMEAMELMEGVKTPVFWFCHILDNYIWIGEAVDRLLNCTENEMGIVMPEWGRKYVIETYKPGPFGYAGFKERVPESENFVRFFDETRKK